MMYPFLNWLNGQQLWHFTVISLFVILPALNVASNLYTTLHCVDFTIKDEYQKMTFILHCYCDLYVYNRMRTTTHEKICLYKIHFDICASVFICFC